MIVIGILLPVCLNCSNSFGCCSIKASSFSRPSNVVNSHNPKASPLMISSASFCCSSDLRNSISSTSKSQCWSSPSPPMCMSLMKKYSRGMTPISLRICQGDHHTLGTVPSSPVPAYTFTTLREEPHKINSGPNFDLLAGSRGIPGAWKPHTISSPCRQNHASRRGADPKETLQEAVLPGPAYQEHPHRGCHPDHRHVRQRDRPQVEKLRQTRHERDSQQPDQQYDCQPSRTAVAAEFVATCPEPAGRLDEDHQ